MTYITRPGGKTYQADDIVKHILPRLLASNYTYCEPFFGGGNIFFHLKRTIPKLRAILGDINDDLANFWIMATEHGSELAHLIEHSVTSEELFNYYKMTPPEDPLLRAYAFYYIVTSSLYGKAEFGSGTFKKQSGKDGSIPNAARREFVSAVQFLDKSIFFHSDFEEVINRALAINSKTMIYVDPPYYGTEFYYHGKPFGKVDHERLFHILDGKNFVASYGKNAYIEELYRDYEILDISRASMLSEKNKRMDELIILGHL